MKRAPFADFGFDPDPSAMPRHDPAAQGQANAGSWKLIMRVQAAKNLENPLVVFGVNSDAIVAYGNDPLTAILVG